MYTCNGCGYRGDSVGHYGGVTACNMTCAERAWRDRQIKAKRAYNRAMGGVR